MINKDDLKPHQIWLPFLIAVFTALGMVVGFRLADEENDRSNSLIQSVESEQANIGRIEELLRLIDARYVDDIDEEVLINAATQAIINQLDPHSVYIPPENLLSVNETMSGFYEGIGIETILVDDTLNITHILDESPAYHAQLKYGDKIISVNDTVIAGVEMPMNEQWTRMKSTDGNPLKLQIKHFDNSISNITVNPDQIKYPNVDYFSVQDAGYINISKFTDKTYEELIKALEVFQQDKIIDKLIIDLRNNPGGFLPEATKILNQFFLEDKRLLVYTKDGKERKNEYNTTGRPFYKINKLAILINENSASASEIIAGAVQDWDKAIIIGDQSYGKGLVQEQYNLMNGGAIRLTIARYFTPSGRYIQTPFKNDLTPDTSLYQSKILKRPLVARGGITPDIVVSWNEDEKVVIQNFQKDLITRAYQFVTSNINIVTETNIDLDEYDNQLKSEINLYLDSNNNLDKELYIDLLLKLYKEEIYHQLGNDSKAQALFADYDIYVQEAIEAMNKEDIFADLTN